MPGWLRRLLGRPRTEERSGDGRPDPARSSQPDPPPPTPLPTPPPEPAPAPADPEPPPAAASQERIIHVHADRLDERPGPRRLTPSEALMLASDGPDALRREPEER